jgi:hypothetical protein
VYGDKTLRTYRHSSARQQQQQKKKKEYRRTNIKLFYIISTRINPGLYKRDFSLTRLACHEMLEYIVAIYRNQNTYLMMVPCGRNIRTIFDHLFLSIRNNCTWQFHQFVNNLSSYIIFNSPPSKKKITWTCITRILLNVNGHVAHILLSVIMCFSLTTLF